MFKNNYIRYIFLVLLILQFSNTVARVNGREKNVQVQTDEAGVPEVYLSLSRDELRKNMHILKYLSIDYFENGRVYAYCNETTLRMIREAGLEYQVEKSPGNVDYDLNMKSWEELLNKDLALNWDFYPTYDAYENLMYQFEQEYPDLCMIYNAGTLPGGRSILFAKISTDVNQDKILPRFMYTSTMHGDETTGFVILLRLIDHLLSNYGKDETVTYIMDNLEIWICPNENPDGTYTDDNSTVNGATRGNANGVDLNRNYTNPVVSPVDPIQPETQAMIRLTDSLNFVISANIHGGVECVNFPFDSWKSAENKHADHFWWTWIAHEYADTARYYSPADYMNPTGQSFNKGVTHGGDWYVIHGSRQDYMNYYANQRELTLEISRTKLLPPSELPAHWEYNYRSLLNYMKQAKYGFRGTVSDFFTGEPMVAKVEIMGYDKDNSHVFSSLPFGDFYRPVAGGIYSLKFSAEGYEPTVLENLSISDYTSLTKDVRMVKENAFSPPKNLIAEVLDTYNVYLMWEVPEQKKSTRTKPGRKHDTIVPDSYRIYRNNEFIAETDQLNFFDGGLEPGNYEYYTLAYYDEYDGISNPSNIVSVTIFELPYFTINATSDPKGAIIPGGITKVSKGSNQSFEIVPDEGYFLSELWIDGYPLGLISMVEFVDIDSDHTIHAVFSDTEPLTYTLNFLVKDPLQQPVNDATITLNGWSNSSGDYRFLNLTPRSYAYSVSKEYFITTEGTIEIMDQDVIKDVNLTSEPTSVALLEEGLNILSLYPNPATEKVFVESSHLVNRVALVDTSGRVLLNEQPGNKEFTLSLSGLKTGMYFVIIYSEQETFAHKLQVKQSLIRKR
jgi:hypothetical protein